MCLKALSISHMDSGTFADFVFFVDRNVFVHYVENGEETRLVHGMLIGKSKHPKGPTKVNMPSQDGAKRSVGITAGLRDKELPD